MAQYEYSKLKSAYKDFEAPLSYIIIGETKLKDKSFEISDVRVEMSSGYEASIAEFWLYSTYDTETSSFKTEDLKKFLVLGARVVIALGYSKVVRNVFTGFIARVNFDFREGDIPGVRITCMDVKGLMMSSCYSHQIAGFTVYSDAVKEVFRLTQERSNGLLENYSVADTPDKPKDGGTGGGGGENTQEETDKTIEMVNESDYEFVVKAGKKFNYEFFASEGMLYFRKAKNNKDILMDIEPSMFTTNVSIEYDMTGLLESITVRGVNAGDGKIIESTKKREGKISVGKNAQAILKGTSKLYIDPTISSQQDADNRADYLLETMSCRFGTLTAKLKGIPELVPGRYINVKNFGDNGDIDTSFYIVEVRHVMNGKTGSYTSEIKAVSSKIGLD